MKSSMSNKSQAVTNNEEKKVLIKEQWLTIMSKHKMLVAVSFRPPTITGPCLHKWRIQRTPDTGNHPHGVFNDGSMECERNWLSLLSREGTEKFSEFLGKSSKRRGEGHPQHLLLPRASTQPHPDATVSHTGCLNVKHKLQAGYRTQQSIQVLFCKRESAGSCLFNGVITHLLVPNAKI